MENRADPPEEFDVVTALDDDDQARRRARRSKRSTSDRSFPGGGEPTCEFQVFDAFSGNDLPVNVAITNQPGDPVDCIKIVVTNADGSTGDIRGVYFNLGNGYDTSTFAKTTINILSWVGNNGVTTDQPTAFKFQCSATGSFNLISPDAQMTGGGSGGTGGRVYNCALEVSTLALYNDDEDDC